jgi:hypothetical protein
MTTNLQCRLVKMMNIYVSQIKMMNRPAFVSMTNLYYGCHLGDEAGQTVFVIFNEVNIFRPELLFFQWT